MGYKKPVRVEMFIGKITLTVENSEGVKCENLSMSLAINIALLTEFEVFYLSPLS